MCFIQNKEFYCECKAVKLDVPHYLKDKAEWDTSGSTWDSIILELE